MKLTDLTVGHYGRTITISHGQTKVTGQLQYIEPAMAYEHTFGQHPDDVEPIITGYELTVGGWQSPSIRPDAEVTVYEEGG